METAEQVQWRNIQKVVRALADFCFESKDHPKFGSYWLAVVHSLTASDGVQVELEKLPKKIPERYLRMEANAQLQNENKELLAENQKLKDEQHKLRRLYYLASKQEALAQVAYLCYSVPVVTEDPIEQQGRDRTREAIHKEIFELQEKLNKDITEFTKNSG